MSAPQPIVGVLLGKSELNIIEPSPQDRSDKKHLSDDDLAFPPRP